MNVDKASRITLELLAPPPGVAKSVAIGEVLVADAHLPDPATHPSAMRKAIESAGFSLSSVRTEGAKELLRLVEDQPAYWRPVILALVATSNEWVDLDDLLGGAAHRRLDSIYDMFDTKFCAHEMQSTYFTHVEHMLEASKNDVAKWGVEATRWVGAFGGVWIGVGDLPAQWVADWLDERLATTEPTTLALGQVSLTWAALIGEGELPEYQAQRIDFGCRESLRRASDALSAAMSAKPPAQAGRLIAEARMWTALVELMTASRRHETPWRVMPQLRGQPLPSAKRQAEALDQECTWVDAVGDRNVATFFMKEADWRVVGQYPNSGTRLGESDRIALSLARYDEGQVPRADHCAQVAVTHAARH